MLHYLPRCGKSTVWKMKPFDGMAKKTFFHPKKKNYQNDKVEQRESISSTPNTDDDSCNVEPTRKKVKTKGKTGPQKLKELTQKKGETPKGQRKKRSTRKEKMKGETRYMFF